MSLRDPQGRPFENPRPGLFDRLSAGCLTPLILLTCHLFYRILGYKCPMPQGGVCGTFWDIWDISYRKFAKYSRPS